MSIYVGCLPCAKGTWVGTLDAAHAWTERHWLTCKRTKELTSRQRGVTPKEKYAEVGEERPRCDCHGEPMVWSRRPRRQEGGEWSCAVRRDRARSAQSAREAPGAP
jgi:hypothetical protein